MNLMGFAWKSHDNNARRGLKGHNKGVMYNYCAALIVCVFCRHNFAPLITSLLGGGAFSSQQLRGRSNFMHNLDFGGDENH